MDKEKEKLIIDNIKNLAKKINKTPRRKDYIKEYKTEVFENFGGYSKLVEKAGFIPNKRTNLTKEEIINRFVKYYKEHYIVPSSMHIPKELPSYDIIFNKFGSYDNFLRELNLNREILNHFAAYSKEDLIKFLQEKVDEGIIKQSKDLKVNPELPFLETIQYVFNKKMTFNELMIAIDRPKLIKNIKKPEHKEYSKEQLIEIYQELSDELNIKEYGATSKDLLEHRGINLYIIDKYFGSINNLREILGYKTIEREKFQKYNKEEIRQILIKKIKSKGKMLKIREIEADEDLPSIKTICKLFGETKIENLYKKIMNR